MATFPSDQHALDGIHMGSYEFMSDFGRTVPSSPLRSRFYKPRPLPNLQVHPTVFTCFLDLPRQ